MNRLLLYRILFVLCLINLYCCKVKDLAVSDIDMASFRFNEVTLVNAKLSDNNTFTLTVPYGTNLKALTPTFTISAEGTSVPKSAISQDFSVPVYYTTIHSSGGKKIFTVKVVEDAQPMPEIQSLSVDSIYAGNKFTVIGKNFGRFSLDVSAKLISADGTETQYGVQLIDSTKAAVSIPDSLKPGIYSVKIKIKSLEATSPQKIKVMYPVPVISTIPAVNILQTNEIALTGKYILPTQYEYQVHLKNATQDYRLVLNNKSENNWVYSTVTTAVKEGKYSVSLINQTNRTESGVFKNTVTIYDNTKPFITAINTPKDSIAAGKLLSFKTINFDKYTIRFYQLTLDGASKSYIINGIYYKATQDLGIILPENMIKGKYGIVCNLGSDTYSYNFLIDTTIEIK